MLRLAISEEIVHLQWLNRQGKVAVEPPELDIIILPGEAEISQVVLALSWKEAFNPMNSLCVILNVIPGPQDAQPGSRYLHLKFNDALRQEYFFW